MSTRSERLSRDESGAILVLGIFMCACLVSLLWFLAGIGDAIVYRERLQEASDAVALSAALLHARGMNLIVMINLIMAAILGIRVAMRAVEAICLVVGAILSVIPFTAAVGGILLDIAEMLNTAVEESRQPMDNLLKVLSKAEVGIQHIVPPAAIAGSLQVGNRYAPAVQLSAAGNPTTIAAGLPVAEDTPDKLCQKAGESVTDIMLKVVPIIPSSVAGRIKKGVGNLVKAGGAYFCGFGGGSPPDLSGMLSEGQDEACTGPDGERAQLEKKAQDAARAYNEACAEFTTCGGKKEPTAGDQARLASLDGQRSSAQRAVDNFDPETCKKEKQQQIQQKYNDATSKQSNSTSDSTGLTPKKVKNGWYNGINEAQVVAFTTGTKQFLERSPKGVIAGAWKSDVTISMPASAIFGLAQAEFYYDCTGAWNANPCNDDPMWNFYWRARLRRYNAPFSTNSAGLERITELVAGGDAFAKIVRSDPLKSVSAQNAILFGDLLEAARSDLIIH